MVGRRVRPDSCAAFIIPYRTTKRFSVGCERGVHYYTMQFVEGMTLAEVIRDHRRRVWPD